MLSRPVPPAADQTVPPQMGFTRSRPVVGRAGYAHRIGSTGLEPIVQYAVMPRVRLTAQAAANLLFPPRCMLCSGWPDSEVTPTGSKTCPRLCARCAAAIQRERNERACPRCAASVAPYEVSNGRCASCRRRRPRVAGTVRVGTYFVEAGIAGLGVLLRSYKYHAREELGPVLGEWLADVVTEAPWLEHIEAIVSVPTHWTRRVRRPLYAADAIAAVVARQTGLPHVPILRRVRGGKHQIGLKLDERVANVRGVFAIRKRVNLQQARLLLIDDVKTTGATLNECARVLREGGAEEVYAAVIVTAGFGGPQRKVLPPVKPSRPEEEMRK